MREFIEEKVSKRINGYRNENELIGSEYARENELGRSYKGREVLELIQNAEDELSDEMPKEIYISFDGKTLSVANFGEPFTEEGITSLMYSNTSNKKNRKKKVIGNKGTGFRAILGWAEEIKIDSDDLHIKFSHRHAQEILKNEVYKGESMPKGKKAATLVFPEWCDEVVETKYTTIISLTIKENEKVSDDIREQLSNLNGNLLLFLNRTEKLTINIEGNESCFEKQNINDNRVRLIKTVDGKITYSKEWLLNKKDGIIGDENYAIVIAYDMEGNMPDNPFIYTYFQTDVKFPFPVLLHADFNLNSDRNHLYKNDSSNKQILEDAAALLVDTSIKIYDRGVSYNRIKFLIPRSELDVELQKYGFIDMLKEKMKDAEIFPTVNSKYVVHSGNLKFYSSGIAKYLSGKEFSDLLMYSDDANVDDLLEEFSYSTYQYTEIASKIKKWVENRQVTDENIRKVAYTAIQFIDEFGGTWLFEHYKRQCPAFFYNLDRKLIPSGTSIFLIDENYVVTKPPVFANVEFLDPYMRNYFYKKLKDEDDSNTDVIIDKLGGLNVREYTSEELMDHINGVLKSRISAGKIKDARERWKTFIKWLWSNKKLFIDENVKVSMLFLNRNNELVDSDTLYYGAEYGNTVLEDLLGGVMPQNLVCNLREYIECDSNEELVEFLCLFGMNDLPQMHTVKVSIHTGYGSDKCGEYIRTVFANLTYPVILDNRDVFNDLDSFCRSVNHVDIKRTEIPMLEEILKNCKTSAILKWIQADSKLQNHLYSGFESSVMPVEVIWDDRRTPRPLASLKRSYSYIHYLFNSIPWVDVDGKRYALTDCLLGLDSKDVDLSDYIVEPAISEYIMDINGPKGKIKKEYLSIFEKMQVKREFSDLPPSKIYSVLLYLPTIEESEQVARSFYNSLIDKSDIEYSDKELLCDEYSAYLSEGKILTNNGFQPVSDCYYLDGKDVCEKIAKRYNLICIPKKRSKRRIKRMLGVDQLILIGEIIGTPEIHEENSLFVSDLNQFKTLAFTYRMETVSDYKEEARKFANININICTSILAAYKTEKDETAQEIELDDYEYILDGVNTYYLKVPEYLTFREMKHNMSLASAIANIFSSYLDVSEIVPRFRELYYVGNNVDRELLIQQEFEDDSVLKRAKESLNINEDNQEEFLSILTKLSEKTKSEFGKYIEKIDFENLLADYNVDVIIDIFRFAGIDVSDYNAEDPSIAIDFTAFYDKKVISRMPFFEDKYKITWFRKLEESTIEEKKQLVANFLQFDSISVRTENSIDFDVDKEIVQQLEIDIDAVDINLCALYRKNINTWKSRQVDLRFVNDFINNPENMSLLYYSLFDILSEKYKEYCRETEPEMVDDGEEIINPEESYVVEVIHAKAKRGEKVRKKTHGRTTTGFTQKTPKRDLERVGLAGEQIVYDYLIKDETNQLVHWVSENAKKMGVNPEGGAGFGYDIEYVDSDGQRKYIEVKSAKGGSESGIRFYMSDFEFDFGRKHAENYQIYYVCNVKSAHPQILIFDDVFRNHDFNKKNYTIDISSEYIITAQADI